MGDDDSNDWRGIDTDIELYKFYLELLLKAGGFITTVTGAIVSYYLANAERYLIRLALTLPFVLSFGFLVVCILSIRPARILNEDHARACQRIGADNPYDLSPLTKLLILFSVVFAIICVGLAILFFVAPSLPAQALINQAHSSH